MNAADTMLQAVQAQLARVGSTPGDNDPFHNPFHLGDANLRLVFPHLTAAQRADILADVFFQQQMAYRDQNDLRLIDSTRLDDRAGVFTTAAPRQGRIFCTYHTGSYRHLFHFLLQRGVDTILFIAGKTLEQQGRAFIEGAQRAAGVVGWHGTLGLLNAEEKTSVLQAMRALKRGASVVFYIDGNSGVGSNRGNEGIGQVQFFGQQLLARVGVAYLGHLSGAPIVPVVCTRDDRQALTLATYPAIVPDQRPREQFAAETTQALYDILAAAIAQRPGLWEGWLYIEKFFAHRQPAPRISNPARPEPGASLAADTNRFALLAYPGHQVLLDKQRHSCVMLPAAAADLFRRATMAPVPDTTPEASRDLLALGALVAAA